MKLRTMALGAALCLNLTAVGGNEATTASQLQKNAISQGAEGLFNALRAPGILSLGATAVYSCTFLANPVLGAAISLPIMGLTIGTLSADQQRLFDDIQKNSKQIVGTLGYWTLAGAMIGTAAILATLPGDYKYHEKHYFSVLSEFERLLSTTILSPNPFVAGGTRMALLYRALTLTFGKKLTPEYIGGYQADETKKPD